MKELIWGFSELVFPKFCIICCRGGVKICLECSSNWTAKPHKIKLGDTNLYFIKDYDSEAAKVTLLAKENHNKEAINLISFSIFLSIKALISESKLSQTINIVTIPSSAKTIMKRGRDNISDICNKVIELLRKEGINANNSPVLTQVRRVLDQSKLNRVERIRNLDYAYGLKKKQLDGNSCILMDDLITTGSSLSEAIRALSEAKITILGAVTACAVGRQSLIR